MCHAGRVLATSVDRVTQGARAVAEWARANPWPFAVGVFVLVFVVELPFSSPPWDTWENLFGNAAGGLVVVAILAGYINLWPNSRRLHWRRARRL